MQNEPQAAPHAGTNSTRVLIAVWIGQLLSLLGTGLTSFALGLEVYKRTGSITKLSLVTFFSTMPAVLVAPFAGALVDRFNRRKVMLLSDLGAGIGSIVMLGLISASEAGLWQLETWHLYLPFAVGAISGSFYGPALGAATAQLVPKQHLGRANGLLELAGASSQLIAPVLAGALVMSVGLRGILMIDLATFGIAFSTILFIRIPNPPRSESAPEKKSLREDVALGWSFIRTRPGLMGLLVSSSFTNLVMGMVVVLITPLVLSFGTPATLGLILSLSAVGMLLGGIALSIWGGPKKMIRGILGLQLVAGLVLFGGALPPSMLTITLCAGLFLFTMPLMGGTAQTLWQRKVPQGMHGRVFATRRMIGAVTAPLASLLSGPLADRYFEPWLAPGGALADSVGRVVGTGTGRGVGFLFVVLGLVMVTKVVLVWLNPHVRHLETELPDTLPDRPANVSNLPGAPAPTAGSQGEPALPAASGGAQS